MATWHNTTRYSPPRHGEEWTLSLQGGEYHKFTATTYDGRDTVTEQVIIVNNQYIVKSETRNMIIT